MINPYLSPPRLYFQIQSEWRLQCMSLGAGHKLSVHNTLPLSSSDLRLSHTQVHSSSSNTPKVLTNSSISCKV